MKCPNCGLFHPSRYQQCVSCGALLAEGSSEPEPPAPPPKRPEPTVKKPEQQKQPAPKRAEPVVAVPEEDEEQEEGEEEQQPAQASRKASRKGGKPVAMIAMVCGGILLACAGGTYFFLTRPPEYERLLVEGKAQLNNGQYAFAQKTLEEALTIKPNDPRILLTLARAYVGVDQVEKAWSCVSTAQQNGQGVMTDPLLSSDLANYYRQRNQYQRAAELLRPLSEQGVPKKKTELSDLLAMWGDESFRKGKYDDAVKCWEEIKELKEGARFQEADSRLASIYQKLASGALAKMDNDGALGYYNKLNVLAPSQQSFEKTSDLYAGMGKLDLAIDQLRRAIKLGSGSAELNKKLAGLLAKRGKELLDKGEGDTGYAYLQQAQGLDTKIKVPTVALRGIHMVVDPANSVLSVDGEVWNPGPDAVNYLKLRAELVDTKTGETIWRKESTVVDEFMPPMQIRETKPFSLAGSCPARSDDTVELKVYMDNAFYASYPVKSMGAKLPAPKPAEPAPGEAPPVAPDLQQPAPAPASPEERTLRDLE